MIGFRASWVIFGYFPRKAKSKSTFFITCLHKGHNIGLVVIVETCQGLMKGLLKGKQEHNLSATMWLFEANLMPLTTLAFMYFITKSDLEV